MRGTLTDTRTSPYMEVAMMWAFFKLLPSLFFEEHTLYRFHTSALFEGAHRNTCNKLQIETKGVFEMLIPLKNDHDEDTIVVVRSFHVYCWLMAASVVTLMKKIANPQSRLF